MSWYTENSKAMFKQAIAWRRDGLLGCGKAGWRSSSTELEIKIAINRAKARYPECKECESFGLSEEDYMPVEDLPGNRDEIVKTDKGCLATPEILAPDGWEKATDHLRQIAPEIDFMALIKKLLGGQLTPVIIFEDRGIVSGEDSANLANALDIPVKTRILRRRE